MFRGRETSMRYGNIDRLPLARPQLGTWPTTQACTLTGNRTDNLLVCGMTSNLLSHTSQGQSWVFMDIYVMAMNI